MQPIVVEGVAVGTFGKFLDRSLFELADGVITEALNDAAVEKSDIDMAIVANGVAAITTGQVSVVGQSVLRPAGFEGLPVYNLDNACAGSSSALSLAMAALSSGSANKVLVLGVEKMFTDDRALNYRALNGAVDRDFLAATGFDPSAGSVFVQHVYPERFSSYDKKYGLDAEALAHISVKNRENASLNPHAQFRTPMTREQVLESRMIADPITAFMCAPLSDGAAALILSRAENANNIDRAIWIRSSAVGSGSKTSTRSSVRTVAERAYAQAGLTPQDISVAEVHDSIAFNEMIAYEELGFCEPGEGAAFALSGKSSRDGLLPVNTGGGLESRGHPMAATGAAQITELVQQLRGEAGERQVAQVRHALAENAGGHVMGDTASTVVSILSHAREI